MKHRADHFSIDENFTARGETRPSSCENFPASSNFFTVGLSWMPSLEAYARERERISNCVLVAGVKERP